MTVEPKKSLSQALIITAHRDYAVALRTGLLTLGSDPTTRVDFELDALRAMQLVPQHYDLIVIDMILNAMDGVQLLLLFRQQAPGTKFVIVHDEGDETAHSLAYQNGANLFLERPRTEEALQAWLRAIAGLIRSAPMEIPAAEIEDEPPVCLADLIQTRCLSGDSVLLHVRSRERSGDIFIHQGEVFHAQYPGKSGEPAFYEIAHWDDGQLRVKTIQLGHLPPRTIKLPYSALLQQVAEAPKGLESLTQRGELLGIAQDSAAPPAASAAALEAPPRADEAALAPPEDFPDPQRPTSGATTLPVLNAHWKINLMGKLVEGSQVSDPERCAFITSFVYRKLADVAVTLEVDYFSQLTLWGPHLQQVLVADNLGVRHAVFETHRTEEAQRDQYLKWCREQSF